MTQEKLNIILEKHKHWLNRDCEGWERMRANLRNRDLTGLDFADRNLRNADLREAILYRADLTRADLREANLREANLYRANLTGADLREANLYEADLTEAIMPNIQLACPSKGSFIAYKKSGVFKGSRYIIKLQIPEDAKRSSATTKKCRCDKAIVLAIENLDGTESDIKEIQSAYDSRFIYKVGETVTVNDFNPCRWNECDPGIHFFIDREEAVDY